MQVRRTIENGVYVYHLAEACPRGDVGQVRLWRNDRGYFGEITHREKAASIPFNGPKELPARNGISRV
jgi:hypothetical protein